MFVRQPQFRNSNADVQIFNSLSRNTAGSEPDSTDAQRAWNKPPGVSHVYMMLIGCGGNGDNAGSGGGSGAVTVWYGAAQNVPDSLIIHIGNPFQPPMNTYVKYRNGTATYILLQANSASGAGAGSAMTANAFAASGFFQSVAGQSGSGPAVSASPTTFLSGGLATSNALTANYGYTVPTGGFNGYFMLQPIIVGAGGKLTGNGGIGCGGGETGAGGAGMVLIASW